MTSAPSVCHVVSVCVALDEQAEGRAAGGAAGGRAAARPRPRADGRQVQRQRAEVREDEAGLHTAAGRE